MIPQMKEDIVNSRYPGQSDEGERLTAQDIEVLTVNVDYGMKEKNPVDHVRFYKKSNVLNRRFAGVHDNSSPMLLSCLQGYAIIT